MTTMKKHLYIQALLMCLALPLTAQSPVNEFGIALDDSVRLESLHASLVVNWPLARQIPVANQLADLNLESIAAAWFPELTLSASAQYQTDVTEIALPIPGATPRTQPKDRYAITLDVRQMIYDGGMSASRRDLEEWSRQAEKTAVDVELYKLSHQLNDAFFSALILKEQEASLMLFLADVDARLAQLETAVAAGSVLPVQADVMRVEKLKVEQRLTDTRRHLRRAFERMSILSGVPIDGSQPLATPVALRAAGRPETTHFQARRGLLDAKKALSRTSRRPVVSAFGQAAYANPGLDIFADAFGPYAIVGVTAKWAIWDRGLSRRETTSLTLQQRSLAAQEDALSRTWTLQAAQHQAEIDRLSEALRRDAEILELRARIVETYATQLENGTITATDYLTERNAAHQADVQLRINQLLQLQARLALSLTLGE
jgi:outer membrane protein TolC